MALPIVEMETLCPNSSSKAWRCSSRVRSSLASRCLGSHSLSITPFLEGLPGIGSGSTSPVSRRLLSQRFMEGIETEKVFATCSLGLPESTAESTLNLRSFEYGFMPEGYHIWIDTYGCRCEYAASWLIVQLLASSTVPSGVGCGTVLLPGGCGSSPLFSTHSSSSPNAAQ